MFNPYWLPEVGFSFSKAIIEPRGSDLNVFKWSVYAFFFKFSKEDSVMIDFA